MGVASIEKLDLQSKNGINYLPIRFNFPPGKGVSFENSTLVRPLENLLKDGRPLGKFNYIFYHYNDDYRIIGTIINTGKKLIFFPATSITKVSDSPPDEHLIHNISLNIDHFTLDENLEKWHITFKEKKGSKKHKFQTRKTKKIHDSLRLWFVMTVQSLNKLEKMPKFQEYKLFAHKEEERERRFSEFIDAREGSMFPVISDKGNPATDWYLNIEFFIGENNSEDYREDLPQTPTVYHANHLSSNKGKPVTNLHTRDVFVNLTNFDARFWVRISKMPGILDKEAYFIPGSDFK